MLMDWTQGDAKGRVWVTPDGAQLGSDQDQDYTDPTLDPIIGHIWQGHWSVGEFEYGSVHDTESAGGDWVGIHDVSLLSGNNTRRRIWIRVQVPDMSPRPLLRGKVKVIQKGSEEGSEEIQRKEAANERERRRKMEEVEEEEEAVGKGMRLRKSRDQVQKEAWEEEKTRKREKDEAKKAKKMEEARVEMERMRREVQDQDHAVQDQDQDDEILLSFDDHEAPSKEIISPRTVKRKHERKLHENFRKKQEQAALAKAVEDQVKHVHGENSIGFRKETTGTYHDRTSFHWNRNSEGEEPAFPEEIQDQDQDQDQDQGVEEEGSSPRGVAVEKKAEEASEVVTLTEMKRIRQEERANAERKRQAQQAQDSKAAEAMSAEKKTGLLKGDRDSESKELTTLKIREAEKRREARLEREKGIQVAVEDDERKSKKLKDAAERREVREAEKFKEQERAAEEKRAADAAARRANRGSRQEEEEEEEEVVVEASVKQKKEAEEKEYRRLEA